VRPIRDIAALHDVRYIKRRASVRDSDVV